LYQIPSLTVQRQSVFFVAHEPSEVKSQHQIKQTPKSVCSTEQQQTLVLD
jgi:hypothetical protein